MDLEVLERALFQVFEGQAVLLDESVHCGFPHRRGDELEDVLHQPDLPVTGGYPFFVVRDVQFLQVDLRLLTHIYSMFYS